MYISVHECTGNLHKWVLKHVSGIKVIGTVANCGRLARAVSSTSCFIVDVT